MHMKQLAAALVITSLLIATQPARATSVRAMSDQQKIERAAQIVFGTVERSLSLWDDARRLIVTDVQVRVSQRLKGQGGDMISFRQLGGTVGDTTLRVAGTPLFTPGQRVLLLLARHSTGGLVILGINRGAFLVRQAADGQDMVVAPGYHANLVGQVAGAAGLVLPRPDRPRLLTHVVADIRQEVRP